MRASVFGRTAAMAVLIKAGADVHTQTKVNG
jgi:hypothetical protein